MPVPHPSSKAASLVVGCEHELDILWRHLDNAVDGKGILVLIGGEVGIGKTGIAEALCHEAGTLGARVFAGHYYDLSLRCMVGDRAADQ